MLGLSFTAALRSNGLLMLAYALAALGGAIAAPLATHSLPRAVVCQRHRTLWQHAQLARLPVALRLIDSDHFKACNDRYGHQEEDRCLREVEPAQPGAALLAPLALAAGQAAEFLKTAS